MTFLDMEDQKKSTTPTGPLLFFGSREMTSNAAIGGLLLVAFCMVATVFLLNRLLLEIDQPISPETVTTVQVEVIENPAVDGDDPVTAQIKRLKDARLWDLAPGQDIPPVIFPAYPEGLHHVTDMQKKKKLFLNTLLPVALTALQEIKRERKTLQEIIKKTGIDIEQLDFAEERGGGWERLLLADESRFIRRLIKKYRTTSAKKLVNRIDVVPVSLILAQAAIESSWGSSRFSRTGNNIFGMWTWGKKGIIPARRDEGKSHKIKIYDSILDSVRAYLLTLNRLEAYGPLRLIRRHTNDSLLIAEGLTAYSERGGEYVQEVIEVINHNGLKLYDRFNLAAGESEDLRARISNLKGAHEETTL